MFALECFFGFGTETKYVCWRSGRENRGLLRRFWYVVLVRKPSGFVGGEVSQTHNSVISSKGNSFCNLIEYLKMHVPDLLSNNKVVEI